MRLSTAPAAAIVTALLLPAPGSGQTAVDVAAAGHVHAAHAAAVTAGPGRIVANDNRQPAGRVEDGVLTLRLEAREGMWHPHGYERDGIPIGAFAEVGGPLQIPGPLIRVTVGTEVHATIHNALERPLAVFGLGAERGLAEDSVLIEPGRDAEFRFVAGEPGTYYYLGRTALSDVPGAALTGSLHGALIIDPPGSVVAEGDRVFVISSWFTFDTKNFSHLSDDAVLTANGQAWPNTDIVEATQGDTLEWRWINMTVLEHPMHLHGFHFRVDARGDGVRDTIFTAERHWLAVTERVGPGSTLTTRWSPERPGNWIYHCHMLGHMTPIEIINAPFPERGAAHGGDAQHQMGQLVVGIRVAPSGRAVEESREPRHVRLLVRSRPGVYDGNPGYAYVLGDSPAARAADALPLPGPTLVFTKGEPAAVNIVNQSHEPAAVHWHGIELESYADGVPGWSGAGERVMPVIPPGDSLTVRFTPPRAGTFMYHSHFNEMQQISTGLYGPIVVLEPGATFDPETDRLLVLSDGGPWTTFTQDARVPPTFLNGRAEPDTIRLRAGTTYRFRIVNILTESSARVALLDGNQPVAWRAIAKDGADLPPWLATHRPAQLTFFPGEIHDYEFTPAEAGDLTLGFGKGAPWNTWAHVAVQVR
jgi:FtsP/CotA-like multicopper oxidase with cupredoxin domain